MSYGIDESPALRGVATPSVTIHALELARGFSAIVLGVEFEVLSDEGHSRSRKTTTDGPISRCSRGPSFAPVQSSFRFAIGKYFGWDRQGPPKTPSGWLDILPVRFDIVRLHVGMLMIPYSYTFYRGS